MSLYIGKDDNNNMIAHITNQEETVASMQSGLLPSTTFHSDIQYLRYETYDAVSTSYHSSTDCTIFTFSSYVRTLISSGRAFICTAEDSSGNVTYLDSTGRSLNYEQEIFRYQCIYVKSPTEIYLGPIFHNINVRHVLTIDSDYAYTYLAYKKKYNVGYSIKIHFFNILNYNIIPYVPSVHSFKLSNSELTINGNNFITTKYISPEIINNIDPVITIKGHTFQLINYYPPSTGVTLETSPNVAIKVGDKVIYTSEFINPTLTYNSSHAKFVDTSYCFNFVGDYTMTTLTELGAFNNNDLLVAQFRPFGGSYIPNTMLIKYKTPASGRLLLGTCYTEWIYDSSEDRYVLIKINVWSDTNGHVVFTIFNSAAICNISAHFKVSCMKFT